MTTDQQKHLYEPTEVTPPGFTLKDILKERGIFIEEFSLLTKLSEDHINKILTGECKITKEIASIFQSILGVPETFWLTRESNYQKSLKVKCSDYPFIPISNDVSDGKYWVVVGHKLEDGTFIGDDINNGKIKYYYAEVYTIKESIYYGSNTIHKGRYINALHFDGNPIRLDYFIDICKGQNCLLKIETPSFPQG